MKLWRTNTINGDWERKIEITIYPDGSFQLRWPKYNLLGWIFRRFFTIVINQYTQDIERQIVIDGSVKEYDNATGKITREY